MIFQTQNQVNIILIFIFFGILLGFISIVFFTLFLKNFQKILIKSIINCVFYVFFSVFFIFLLNFFNFGKFNLTLTLCYIFGFAWFVFLCRNLVVILEKKWYNIIKSKFKTFKTKLKKEKTNTHEQPKKS